jgi:2-amino-4-hydroxy-6-hydroxymethyldihydropteridine diphosphokinase
MTAHVELIGRLPEGYVEAYLGLGSNQGDRLAQLSEALYHISAVPDLIVLKVSSAYESVPSNMPPGTRDFLNAVVKIAIAMSPEDLLATCMGIERLMGRFRTWIVQDRPIDIDILSIDGANIRKPDLIIPHPRAHTRTFVLKPWIEIEPGFSLYGARLEEWLDMLPIEEYVPCGLLDEIPEYQTLA